VNVIRRLYLYAMSGVMLAILAAGLQLLVAVLFDSLGIAGEPLFGGESSRQQLSIAGALIAVGLPVWLLHWWLVRSGLHQSGGRAEEERQSGLRAFYLAGVLAISLVFFAGAATEIVRAVLLTASGLAAQLGARPDLADSLATLIVGGGVWASHVAVRRSDLAVGPMTDAAAAWPRVYLYGAVLLSAVVGIEAFGRLVDALAGTLLDQSSFGGSDGPRFGALSEASTISVTAAIALGHLWYSGRLLADPGWRGEGERPSALRLSHFMALLGIAAASITFDLIDAGRAVLVEALGAAAAEPGHGRAGYLARVVVAPLLASLPWLAVGWLAHQQATIEARRSPVHGRAIAVVRLESYLLTLIGLAFGGIGLGWLAGLALDALLGGQRLFADGTGWKFELASFLPAAGLGLMLWAWQWSRTVARTAADRVSETGSSARRAALLLVLAVSLVAAVGSLAVILYRVFNLLLGIPLARSVISELSTPAGALLVAGAIAAYHGVLVRRDMRPHAGRTAEGLVAGPEGDRLPPVGAAPTPEGASASALEPSPQTPPAPLPPASRPLVLRASSPGELDGIVATLRSILPPGARLDDG
jgi:hypothetical protein